MMLSTRIGLGVLLSIMLFGPLFGLAASHAQSVTPPVTKDIVDDDGSRLGSITFATLQTSAGGITEFGLEGFTAADLFAGVWQIDGVTGEVSSLNLAFSRDAVSETLPATVVCLPPAPETSCTATALFLGAADGRIFVTVSSTCVLIPRDSGLDELRCDTSTGPVTPFALVDRDVDGDGVDDVVDACLTTAAGAITDASGCSIADFCPCEGDWKNHGAYVRCVSRTAVAFAEEGLIGGAEKGAHTSAAAKSSCGKAKKRSKGKKDK